MTDKQTPIAPSTPTGVPDKVTRQQVRVALGVLGLPADAIDSVHIDMDLISMTVLVRSPDGSTWARDTGRPLTAAAYVDVVEDPRPQRPATGGKISPQVLADPEQGPDGCIIPSATASTPDADRIQVRLSCTAPEPDAYKRLFLGHIVPARAARLTEDADILPDEG
ncbi:hypothetical protein ACWC5I_25720 [Kitasatospora sp. NPDC001574]